MRICTHTHKCSYCRRAINSRSKSKLYRVPAGFKQILNNISLAMPNALTLIIYEFHKKLQFCNSLQFCMHKNVKCNILFYT